MEPITYFVNHGFVLMTMVYYIMFHRDFAFNEMHTRLKKIYEVGWIRGALGKAVGMDQAIVFTFTNRQYKSIGLE